VLGALEEGIDIIRSIWTPGQSGGASPAGITGSKAYTEDLNLLTTSGSGLVPAGHERSI